MRGRIALRVVTTRLQATDRGPRGHPTIIQRILGAIDTRLVAAIDTHQGTGAIQIAIAGGTG
jgi:hypothetical protein